MTASEPVKVTIKQLQAFEAWAQSENLNLSLSRQGYTDKDTKAWLTVWIQEGPEAARKQWKATKKKSGRKG